MSSQWEVVGKRKEKGTSKFVTEKVPQDTKKKLNNSVKLEEVLPMSKVKNIYNNSGKGNKENQKPTEKNKVQENGTKKVQKKDDKPQEPKVKSPKTLEAAITLLKVEELIAVLEKYQTLFPDAPIVWLKEMAQFINVRIPLEIQDPVFSNKASNYPLSVMPTPIKAVFDKAIKDAGPTNSAVFYDICLTTMATDMNKDLSAIGHKIFIQYLALNDPKIACNNINKYNILRNSYQNKQAIGLSILWALGQAGFKDFNVGMKVFQEVMLPLLEMKNYSRFVIKYLISIVLKQKESAIISRDYYLLISDIAHMNKKNVPTDLNKELLTLTPKLNNLLFAKGTDKYYSYIEPFLKKIAQEKTNKQYRQQLCEALVRFIEKDPSCLGTWGKIYGKHLAASAILLQYIDENWKTVSKTINTSSFANLLTAYSVINDELNLKKRKDDGLNDSIAAIQPQQHVVVMPLNCSFCETLVLSTQRHLLEYLLNPVNRYRHLLESFGANR